MFRLTREVRFAINGPPGAVDEQLRHQPTNSYGGFPSLVGFGPYLALQVTLAGELDPFSSYLINIKQIDAMVRERAIPVIAAAVHGGQFSPVQVIGQLYAMSHDLWPRLELETIRLMLSP